MAAPRILVAALDWGLGHATRSMPLIEALLAAGAEPVLASSGPALTLWQQAYPELPHVALPAYDIRYSQGPSQVGALLKQVPQLLRTIRAESRYARALVTRYQLRGILSDHRYGLRVAGLPSVFIAHQLALAMPAGLGWARRGLYALHRRFWTGFDEVWVPDYAGSPQLAGDLPRAYGPPRQAHFIGPLSRFAGHRPGPPPAWMPGPGQAVVAILSGPEPARSQLEAQLWAQAALLDRPFYLVAGQPGPRQIQREGARTRFNFLSTPELAHLIRRAALVISRPGYSSLMDYAVLQPQALLLIPTPGQTEQQYLARRWDRQGLAVAVPQAQLDLPTAAAAAQQLAAPWPDFPPADLLRPRVERWLAHLPTKNRTAP